MTRPFVGAARNPEPCQSSVMVIWHWVFSSPFGAEGNPFSNDLPTCSEDRVWVGLPWLEQFLLQCLGFPCLKQQSLPAGLLLGPFGPWVKCPTGWPWGCRVPLTAAAIIWACYLSHCLLPLGPFILFSPVPIIEYPEGHIRYLINMRWESQSQFLQFSPDIRCWLANKVCC